VPPPEAQALPTSLLARFGVPATAEVVTAALHFLASFPTRALQRT
jgi:hypothetical protein